MKKINGMWTYREVRKCRRKIKRMQKSIKRMAAMVHPYECGYDIIRLIEPLFYSSLEYYRDGVDVYQSDDTRNEIVADLTTLVEYIEQYRNAKSIQIESEAYRKIFHFIAENGEKWWD